MSDARRIAIADPAFSSGGSSAFTNFTLNGATDKIEYRFSMPEAAPLTRFAVRYGARTGTPPTYRGSFQGDDGTGIPDGTIKGGGSPASATFTPPADTTWDGTLREIALANSYAAVRGEELFLVLDYSSGTIDASNNSSFTTEAYSASYGLPYAIQNDAGSRTRRGNMPVFAVGSATKWYFFPAASLYATAFNAGSTPDEQGIRFAMDSAWGGIYRIGGARLSRANLTASGTSKLILYDADTSSVIQDKTFDHDAIQANGSYRHLDIPFDEASLVDLKFGQVYRLTIQPQGAVNVIVPGITVNSNEMLSAYPGGTGWYRTYRTDGGAWTDDPLTAMFLVPLIDNWDSGITLCRLSGR